MESEVILCHDINMTFALDLDYTLADTGKLVAGVLIFLLILPFVLFEFPFFPLGTTTAVLVGAALMVSSTVLSQDDAYKHLGDPRNLRTIVLLLGMMLLAQYFERENIINRIIKRLLKDDMSFVGYLWRVCLATSVTAAFITNDAACVVLTPLLLEHWKGQDRPRVELETLLLAIATSANIASAATIFGNPQMALIASKTNVPHHKQSRLDLLRCLTFLGIPTIVGSLLNICFLIIHWKIRSIVLNKESRRSVNANYELRKVFIKKEPIAKDSISPDNENNIVCVESDSVSQARNQKESMDGSNIIASYGQGTSVKSSQQFDADLLIIPNIEVLSNVEVELGARCSSKNQETLQCSRRYSKSLSDLKQKDHLEKLFHDTYTQQMSSRTSNITDGIESCHQSSFVGSIASLTLKSETRKYFEHQENIPKTSQTRIHQTALCQLTGLQVSKKLGICRSVQSISVPVNHISEQPHPEIDIEQVVETEFKASESKVFHVCLWLSVLGLLVLLCVDTERLHFDMGLLPMAAATLIMLVDAFWNRRSSLVILRRVDWSVIVMFLGLFVWMAGLNSTRVPRWIWKNMGLADSQFNSLTSLAVLCVFVVICSNIFSNVPLTIIVLEQLQPCKDQLSLVLYLAWCSTIAGNLTLFGSVANLIVAQKSKGCLGYQFSYWAYLKYGFVTTLVIVVIGIVILNGLLQI